MPQKPLCSVTGVCAEAALQSAGSAAHSHSVFPVRGQQGEQDVAGISSGFRSCAEPTVCNSQTEICLVLIHHRIMIHQKITKMPNSLLCS